MKKRIVAFTVIITICLAIVPAAAVSAEDDMTDAAVKLNTLGLFQGVGKSVYGVPNFALYRIPTRAEAVTVLVRLLGREAEANDGVWPMPFTDVPGWAQPYVGYAFANGLTAGIDAETFGSANEVTASQFLTFVLRALGYTSGADFEWDRAWILSDNLGITDGRFNAGTETFLRGDVAEISFAALSATFKDTDKTLYAALIDNGVFTEDAAISVGLMQAPAPPPEPIPEPPPEPEPPREPPQTQRGAWTEIKIDGDADFTQKTKAALDIIREKTPATYAMVLRYVAIIRQGAQSGMWATLNPPVFVVGNATYVSKAMWYASAIVHDAFHSKLYYDHFWEYGFCPNDIWTGTKAEMACLEIQITFLEEIGAPQSLIEHAKSLRGADWWSVPVKH